ncbi:MAG: hypothetical protein DRR42_03215 [Gammaproteobacteria bacterium]|nr:MAG: hypothetical protein DRR42_03215 [Gammaproteobacteria bacterium]
MDETVSRAPSATESAEAVPPPVDEPIAKVVGLICNPNSGRNKKHLRRIEEIVKQCTNIHYVPTASEHDIPVALKCFTELGIDVLAINGGDGTVAHVLTHLLGNQQFEKLPALVLLPGGTTNMNVGDVGVPGRIIQVVDKLTQWSRGDIPTGATETRPILQVTPGNGSLPLYGMLFGSGAIIQAIEYWHSRVKRSGFRDEFSSGLAMVRTLWGLVRRDPRFSKPVHMVIVFENGDNLELDAMLIAVSSMRRVFLNFSPFWGKESGALHMTVIRDGAKHFLRAVPSVFRGRPNRLVTPESGYHSHNLDSISLLMSGSFTMDGEIYHVTDDNGPVIIRRYCDLSFIRF